MPQKPCINVYCFCMVKMEELFAIAVSFGKIVRNRGFSQALTCFLAPPLQSRKDIFKDDDFYTMEFSSRIYTYCV